MRALLTSFLLVIVALVRGATVTDLVQNAAMRIPTNAALVFTPISAPLWVEGVLTTGEPQGTRVDRYGRISIDLAGGYYSLQVGTNSRRFTVGVPPGTGTYQLAQLVSNTIAFLTNIPPALYEVNTNKGRANGYASLGPDGLVPAEQLPAGNGGGGGVGAFYTNNVLVSSSATQIGATNSTNAVVSAYVSGSRVTFTFNARPATVSAGNGIFVTNVGGSNFIVAGSITAAEFTALTNAVAGLTNLVAAKESTNNSTHFGYLRFPRTNDYLDFNQTWNIRRYPDDTLHFDYPDVAATPLLIRPNGITVSNIYIPGTNVFIQWNGTWSLVAWADGSFRLLNDDTGTTPFSVATDGTVTAPAFVGDGSGLTGLPGLSGLAELHFENESGTPTPGDAIVFRSGGRIWIQSVGGTQTDLEGVATTAVNASIAATAITSATNSTGTGVFVHSNSPSIWNANLLGTTTFDILGFGVGYVTNWMMVNGPFTNAGATYLTALTASRALVLDANKQVTTASGTPDGTKFLRDDGAYAVPAGGGGSSAWNETNIIVSATNNVIWDVAAFDRAIFKGLTNLNLCLLSNVASMTKSATALWQQDTAGTRTVRFTVVGGRLETNAFLEVTTNANKLTIAEFTQSTFPTNAAVKSTTTNITAEPFTNSLASGGGGGGGGPSPLLVETFENGPGFDNTPAQTGGTPEGGFSTSGLSLTGSGCARLNSHNEFAKFTLSSPSSTLTITNQIRWATIGTGGGVVLLGGDSGGGNTFFVYMESGSDAGRLRIYNGTVNSSMTAGVPPASGNQTYYMKTTWSKSTGGNGVATVELSTTTTFTDTGNYFTSITTGDAVNDTTTVSIFCQNDEVLYIDELRVNP